jgi:hypothetical protein
MQIFFSIRPIHANMLAPSENGQGTSAASAQMDNENASFNLFFHSNDYDMISFYLISISFIQDHPRSLSPPIQLAICSRSITMPPQRNRSPTIEIELSSIYSASPPPTIEAFGLEEDMAMEIGMNGPLEEVVKLKIIQQLI